MTRKIKKISKPYTEAVNNAERATFVDIYISEKELAKQFEKDIQEYFNSDELEDLAKDGDIEAITIYCYRTMMMSWVLYYNDGITKRLFGDKEAVDMLPMLLAAAPNEVTCQLILAIIYAGPEAMGLNRDFTYSFRDPEKAKYWLEKFCSNPKRSDAFYWSKKYEVDDIIIPNIRGMK